MSNANLGRCALTHIPLPVPHTEWAVEAEEGGRETLKEEREDDK